MKELFNKLSNSFNFFKEKRLVNAKGTPKRSVTAPGEGPEEAITKTDINKAVEKMPEGPIEASVPQSIDKNLAKGSAKGKLERNVMWKIVDALKLSRDKFKGGSIHLPAIRLGIKYEEREEIVAGKKRKMLFALITFNEKEKRSLIEEFVRKNKERIAAKPTVKPKVAKKPLVAKEAKKLISKAIETGGALAKETKINVAEIAQKIPNTITARGRKLRDVYTAKNIVGSRLKRKVMQEIISALGLPAETLNTLTKAPMIFPKYKYVGNVIEAHVTLSEGKKKELVKDFLGSYKGAVKPIEKVSRKAEPIQVQKKVKMAVKPKETAKETPKISRIEHIKNRWALPRKRQEFIKNYKADNNYNEIDFKGNKAAEGMVGLEHVANSPYVYVISKGGKDMLAKKKNEKYYSVINPDKEVKIHTGDRIVFSDHMGNFDKLTEKAKLMPKSVRGQAISSAKKRMAKIEGLRTKEEEVRLVRLARKDAEKLEQEELARKEEKRKIRKEVVAGAEKLKESKYTNVRFTEQVQNRRKYTEKGLGNVFELNFGKEKAVERKTRLKELFDDEYVTINVGIDNKSHPHRRGGSYFAKKGRNGDYYFVDNPNMRVQIWSGDIIQRGKDFSQETKNEYAAAVKKTKKRVPSRVARKRKIKFPTKKFTAARPKQTAKKRARYGQDKIAAMSDELEGKLRGEYPVDYARKFPEIKAVKKEESKVKAKPKARVAKAKKNPALEKYVENLKFGYNKPKEAFLNALLTYYPKLNPRNKRDKEALNKIQKYYKNTLTTDPREWKDIISDTLS